VSDEVPHEGATVRYGVRAVHGRSSSLPRIPLPVRYATLAALAILPVAPLIARAQQPDGASARARVVARMMRGTVVLDGRLDDSAWAGADSVPGLRQREPREGEPGSERTVVKCCATPTRSTWASARTIAIQRLSSATQYRRDAELDADDNAGFTIDSYDDQRTAFAFATNPNGMMWDAQLSGV